MNNIFIKVFFLLITLYIFFYCCSYVKYQFLNEKKKLSSITVFLFTLFSVILSNVVFWNS